MLCGRITEEIQADVFGFPNHVEYTDMTNNG